LTDRLGETLGLAAELDHGGGAFLGDGGVGLGDLVDLGDGDVYLSRALVLLGGGVGDVVDEAVERLDL
jgi:hypothetical protein